MTLSASPEIHATIDLLEGKVREYETAAGELRDVVATLRRTFEISTLVPVVRETPDPVREPIQAPRGTIAPKPDTKRATRETPERKTARAGKSTRPRVDYLDTERRVMAWLEAQAAPTTVRALRAEFGLSSAPLRQILDSLVPAGRVMRTGTRGSMRIGVPAVMTPAALSPRRPSAEVIAESSPPAAASAVPAPDPAAVATVEAAPTATLREVLLREVFGGLAPMHLGDIVLTVHDITHGAASHDDVLAACQALVREGVCGELRKGGELHFRRLPPAENGAKAERKLLQAIEKVLDSGASFALSELVRYVRATISTVDVSTLGPVMERLASERKVRRISAGGLQHRYQRLAGVKVAAAS